MSIWRELVEADPVAYWCPSPDCSWRVGQRNWGFTTIKSYKEHLEKAHLLSVGAAGAEPLIKLTRVPRTKERREE